MALYRLHIKRFNAPRQAKPGSPRKSQVPVSAHARYLLREMPIEEHLKHALRERPSEQQRNDLVASGSAHLPAWAEGNAVTYWQAAQAYSRAGAVIAKELEVSLPRELTQAENLQLIHAWLEKLPAFPMTFAFHEPRARNGVDTQPHVHILVSPRPDDGRHPDPAVYFKREDHGGVPAQQLWTKKGTMHQLHQDWERLLRSTLKDHGLEHTLDRWHTVPEIALTWKEMQQLERLVKRMMPKCWGHEYRIPPRVLTTWERQGRISIRQAAWLAQRGQRQFTWHMTKAQEQGWAYTQILDTAQPWQLLAKRNAQRGRLRVEATMQTLQDQRHKLAQVYMSWINPALKREQARYRETHSRVLPRGRHQAHERGGDTRHMDLPVLDAALRDRERRREQERVR